MITDETLVHSKM